MRQRTFDKTVISPDVLYRVDLGVDPQDALKIPAGRYGVVAVLHTPFWPPWRWSGNVSSRPVTVQVLAPDNAGPAPTDLEQERLVASIEFYLDAHRFQDAYEKASQLKEHEPDWIYSYVLLGDALNGLRRDQEALETYDYALDLTAQQNSYEPPEYLLMRKHEVQQRLERH
jgi:tetratricopeptide (TPR) repeat protein